MAGGGWSRHAGRTRPSGRPSHGHDPGWSRASIDDETGTTTVDALSTLELTPAVTAEVIHLLADFGREGGGATAALMATRTRSP